MNLERFSARLMTFKKLLLDFRLTGCCQERGQPVHVADHLIGDGARLNFAGPPQESWHPKGTLPICVLLAAEGCRPGVGPGVPVRSIVSAVENNRVLRDAEFVENA